MKKVILLFLCSLIVFPSFSNASMKPEIKAKSGLTIDVESGEIAFAKDIDRVLFPASTTKLVTAILLARYRNRDDILTYTSNAKKTVPYMLDLPVNTKITASDAMDALLLYSANDIAIMIAENIGGNIKTFTMMMNRLVKELNLKNTHFKNPSGLHETGHHTTAYALSIIARHLYHYPWIIETMKKKESTLTILPDIKIDIKNRNKLVDTGGCIGGKTGWTPEAGRCFVALYQRDGRHMIGIVLNSVYDLTDSVVFNDMVNIIDYSYKAGKKPLFHKNDLVKIVPLSFRIFPWFGPKKTIFIQFRVQETISCYMHGEPLTIYYNLKSFNPWNLDKYRGAGTIFIIGKETKNEYPIYPNISTYDIVRENILPFYTSILALLFFFVFCVIIIIMLRGKKD
jgi:D-alanyl-D-alanine carboxypeptidase